GGAGTDGPTRVYSGGAADYDSDELTVQVQSIRRGLPVPLLSRDEIMLPLTMARKAPEEPKPQLAETRPAERRRLIIARRRTLRRMQWVIAGVLLLAALTVTIRYRPAWLGRVAAKFHSSR
ncbi:MAG TPA: hypothetical protein VFQ35_18995, partial [Polyangiaceae bacterium]|nr:hypothetical protein [Polyangiaceae bacterium]